MCASVYSSLLLIVTLAAIPMFLDTKMTAEGLPLLVRQERGVDRGVLAGADFLSVFMRQVDLETATRTTLETATLPESTTLQETSTYAREIRSTLYSTSPTAQTATASLDAVTLSAQLLRKTVRTYEEATSDSIGEVHVSSIGRTLTNKDQIEDTTVRESTTAMADQNSAASEEHPIGMVAEETTNKDQIEDTTVRESTTAVSDQNSVASEEHPISIVAEANKSEFSVEEAEPITTNGNLAALEYNQEYPARVQPLARTGNPSLFNPDSGFQGLDKDKLQSGNGNPSLFDPSFLQKEKLQPIQHTVIYHNNPREPSRARSVSYSTVIQAVPDQDKHWDGEKVPVPPHERRERHYDGTQTSFGNHFRDEGLDKLKSNDTKPEAMVDEKKDWERPEEAYGGTAPRNVTTERNWEVAEKPYRPPPSRSRLPTVYGRPEQNYEVDESASVMTNGRVHGVQPSKPSEVKIGESKKVDDNQKVGYVVEGRNYRKYRVEERTSDGFIVGEYGVVSHDDGSLRGVRYTADETASPRLIYDALMKFLAL